MTRHLGWLWTRAWALLVCAAVCWAANSVAARLAIGEVSPMTLLLFRWIVIIAVLAATVGPALRLHARGLWERRWYVFGLAAVGLTTFNAMIYLAARETTAVNMVLLQSSVPGLVLIGALLRGDRLRFAQVAGVAITMLGVIAVATRGSPETLFDLSFNRGDLMVLAGCVCGAWYNLSLRRRPHVPAIVFFAALAMASTLTSAPLLAIEAARGETYTPSLYGLGIIVFCALGPALGAQVFFLRAVDLIGASRAGVYTNLVPVFGAFMGVGLLGELFAPYHAAGLAFVLVGIWLSERRAGPAKSGRLA